MTVISDRILKRPFLLSGIICAAASVIGYSYKSLLPFFIFAVTAVLGAVIIKTKRRELLTVIFAVVLITFSLLSEISYMNNVKSLAGKSGRCVVKVCDITYHNERYCVSDIKICESDVFKKGIKLSVICFDNIFSEGDFISADITAEAPDKIYEKSYDSNRIYLSGKADNIEILPDRTDKILKAVGEVREYIRNSAFGNLSYESASTLCALTFGEKSYFSNGFYALVTSAGVNHVMVVSGMHLSITASVFGYLINKYFYNKYIKALLDLSVVLFMTALCGFTMSILRAGVMYLIASAGILLDRDTDSENILGSAVTLILIFSPFAVLNLAFELSVLSTFGILCVALPLIKMFNEKFNPNFVLKFISETVTATLSAILFTLPVLIYEFGFVSSVAVITNLLISPAVTAVLWIAVPALISGLFFPLLSELLFSLCEILLKYINSVIKFFGSLPFAAVNVNRNLWILAFAAIIAVLNVLLSCKKRKDMLELKTMNEKIVSEGGKSFKWQ